VIAVLGAIFILFVMRALDGARRSS
jgi:hypothetical protein